jgi:hypothetical protein
MNCKEAKAMQAKTYRGSDCKSLHGGERYTVNGECITCSAVRNKNWLNNNLEQRKAYVKEYKKINAEKIKVYEISENGKKIRKDIIANRKSKGGYAYQQMMQNMRLLNRLVKWEVELTKFVGKEAHHLAKLREKIIGVKWSVDHIIPVRGKIVSGLHTWNNIQVIPMQQNRLKSNHLEI